MTHHKHLWLIGFISLFSASSSFGGGITPTPTTTITATNSSTNVNMGYGGLKWTLENGLVPEIVGGFRYASVTSSGSTQGFDVSIAFKITGETQLDNFIQLGKLRTKYLNGIDYLQGEVGGGWDFANKGLFAGISAQGPYVNTGVDYNFSSNYLLGKSYSPFIMFNSIGIYDRPHGSTSTLTCPADWTLIGLNCVYTGAPA